MTHSAVHKGLHVIAKLPCIGSNLFLQMESRKNILKTKDVPLGETSQRTQLALL
jgi:hypothetical protein